MVRSYPANAQVMISRLVFGRCRLVISASEMEKLYGGASKLRTPENIKHKAIYQWRISHKKQALLFLQDIYPFLIEKKEQAKLAIEFCSLPDLRVNRFSMHNEDVKMDRQIRKNIADKLKEIKHKRIQY